MWKKKIFERDPPLLPDIHFCCCVCVAQQIINSLCGEWKSPHPGLGPKK